MPRSSLASLLLAGCLVNEDLYAIRQGELTDDDQDGFSEAQGDCDDKDAARHPEADELCDGEDDDCDGLTDNDAVDRIWYVDSDGDGYGSEGGTQVSCAPPGSAWQLKAGDCDDGDQTIHPGTTERCNGIDEDCDGSVDEEAVDPLRWYLDADGDGYGDETQVTEACEAPTTAHVRLPGDCDDSRADRAPGLSETCDGVDNDCDGNADEPPVTGTGAWFPDRDGDGYGDATAETARCEGGDGFVSNGEDCDDTDAALSPEAEEICNDGTDNNCDSDPGACVWDAVVDLTDYGILTGEIEIELYGSEFGALDITGDGQAEILVSSPYASSTRDYDDAPGVIEVFRTLPTRGSGRSIATSQIWGQSHLDSLDLARSHGDVNGDAFEDMLLGTRGRDTPESGSGAVHLVYGPSSASGDVNLLSDWTVRGTFARAGVGDVSAILRDLAGEIGPSLVTGSPMADIDTEDDGIVYILTGPGSGEDPIDEVAVATLHGTAISGQFGTDFDAVDVDADGQHDLIVGMPYAYSGGAAFVFLGPIRGTLTEEDADFHLSEEAGSTLLGHAIANAGDQNGDGLEDLLLTDSQSGSGGNYGAAYLLYTAADFASRSVSDADVKIRGDTRLSIGNSGDNIGDLNQDGFTDLAIGSFSSDTAAGFLFFGPLDSTGLRYVSSADVVLQGDTEDSRIHRIVNLGDMNGDGAPDLAVGSPYWDPDYLGRAFFIPGISW